MAKKTKRKLAHSKLPMQRQLNLCHEGKCFDLRAIFDRLNEQHFRGRMRGYKVMWGRKRKVRPKEYFVFGTIQEEDSSISRSFHVGFWNTFFITKCCIQWFPKRSTPLGVGASTRMNLIAANASSQDTGAHVARRTTISPAFFVRLGELRPNESATRPLPAGYQTDRVSLLRSS